MPQSVDQSLSVLATSLVEVEILAVTEDGIYLASHQVELLSAVVSAASVHHIHASTNGRLVDDVPYTPFCIQETGVCTYECLIRDPMSALDQR